MVLSSSQQVDVSFFYDGIQLEIRKVREDRNQVEKRNEFFASEGWKVLTSDLGKWVTLG